MIHKQWPLWLSWPTLAVGEAILCVWEYFLSLWNKTGPEQLVRRVLQWGWRNKVLPVKGRQQKKYLPQPAACCAIERGACSSDYFCFTSSSCGDLLTSWLLLFWEVGSKECMDKGERCDRSREPSLGIIREVWMDFLFHVWKLRGWRSKANLVSLPTFPTCVHTHMHTHIHTQWFVFRYSAYLCKMSNSFFSPRIHK